MCECHAIQGRPGARGQRGFPGPVGIGVKGEPGIPGRPGKPAFIRHQDGSPFDPNLVSVLACYGNVVIINHYDNYDELLL